MGYGFRNDIKAIGKTPEQIEAEIDFVLGHVRSKSYSSPFSGGDYGVFRVRQPKSCYCGGHSQGKGGKDAS